MYLVASAVFPRRVAIWPIAAMAMVPYNKCSTVSEGREDIQLQHCRLHLNRKIGLISQGAGEIIGTDSKEWGSVGEPGNVFFRGLRAH